MVFLRIETTNCDYPRVTFTFSGALWFLTESGRLAFFRPRPLNPFLVVHLANVLIPCTRTGIFGFVFREKLRLYSNHKSQCFNSLEHSSLFDITVYITMEGASYEVFYSWWPRDSQINQIVITSFCEHENWSVLEKLQLIVSYRFTLLEVTLMET